MKLTIDVPDDQAEEIGQLLSLDSRNGSHGNLDLPKLAKMLLEDVALVRSRPGSWEATHMRELLGAHGYPLA